MSDKDTVIDDLKLEDMLKSLEKMALPIRNDHRQRGNCDVINKFLSTIGTERTMLVGSTAEGTKLRSNNNEGDFDYLAISAHAIPVQLLEYRKDVPCFVHIDGRPLSQTFPVELVDGKYLPTSLLLDVSPSAFTVLRGILQLVSVSGTSHGRNTPHAAFTDKTKVGLKWTDYSDFKCDHLQIPRTTPQRNDAAILKELLAGISESRVLLTNDANKIMNLFGIVADVLQDAEKDSKKGLIPQQWWSVLQAWPDQNVSTKSMKRPITPMSIHGKKKCKMFRNDNEDKGGITVKEEKTNTNQDECYEDVDAQFSHAKIEAASQVEEVNVEEMQPNPGDAMEVTATYSYPSHKDLVTVFPLSGKPKGIEDWYKRERHWPAPEVVDQIYRSEFFVAAKEAIVNGNKEIDFCLSCNVAEIKLALAMNKVQKQCILVLKAIQRGVLEEYSEILTSYHWKTAAYRQFEKLDPSTWEQGNVLHPLKAILDFMIACLQQKYLEHFLTPSNLFAGMTAVDTEPIIIKIKNVYEDPTAALRHFFDREKARDHEIKTVKLPVETLHRLQKQISDPSNKIGVGTVLSALEDITRPCPDVETQTCFNKDTAQMHSSQVVGTREESEKAVKTPNVNDALLEFADAALTEVSREKEEEAKGHRVQVHLPSVSKQDVLGTLGSYLSVSGSTADRQRIKEAREDLQKKALSFLFPEVSKRK